VTARARNRDRDRDYSAWIVAGILFVVLAGFSRSFFLRPIFGTTPEWAAPEPIFYLHGTVFAAWFAFLAVQTWLIRDRELRLHRRLGYVGAGLGAGVVILGTYAALRAANRATGFMGVPLPAGQFLAVPLIEIALFAIFLGLAVLNRNKPASHKRLILLASVDLVGAAIARIPLMMPSLPIWLDSVVYAAFVAAIASWDLSARRRLRPETIWGGAALIGLNFAALPIGATEAWQAAAHWMMSFASAP
jgi:uncharacterized membrane protein YozB (DUF420 family)